MKVESVGHVVLIGNGLDELRQAKAHLETHGVRILGMSDHRVSQSLYLQDPDGNGIELFVDGNPAIWARNPAAVATIEPREL
ncbi:MAG: VOC family protein [Candidatus Methylomirabilia bacterium]